MATTSDNYKSSDNKIIQLYVENNCNPNHVVGPKDRTLLHLAVRDYDIKVASMLLKQGADSNAFTEDNLCPLHIAVSNKDLNMVKLLLTYGADSTPRFKFMGKSPMYMAVEYNCIDIAKLLLNRGASTRDTVIGNTTLLHVALKIDKPEMAQLIVYHIPRKHINLKDNTEGKTPLHLAIERNYYEIVRILLRMGANVLENYKSTTPLSIATRTKDEKMIRLLLENGAVGVDTSFHEAVSQGSEVIVSLLLEIDAKLVNSVNKYGSTALQTAVDKGYSDVVEVLLRHGASLTDVLDDKFPLLYTAFKKEDWVTAELLLENGASANDCVMEDQTLLETAVKNDSIIMTKLLLKYGAHINKSIVNRDLAFVIKLLVILEAEGFKISIKNKNIIANRELGKTFHKKCKQEIKRLRKTSITGDKSFYHLFAEDVNDLAKYAKNQDFIEFLSTTDIKTVFPIYSDILSIYYIRGCIRETLLRKAMVCFQTMPNQFALPRVCGVEILETLSNQNLKNFMEGIWGLKSDGSKI